jgi:hypothetical protein
MSKISYFVYYKCGLMYGRAEIAREKPVSSIKDIECMEEQLLNHWTEMSGEPSPKDRILVVNWRRFEEP